MHKIIKMLAICASLFVCASAAAQDSVDASQDAVPGTADGAVVDSTVNTGAEVSDEAGAADSGEDYDSIFGSSATPAPANGGASGDAAADSGATGSAVTADNGASSDAVTADNGASSDAAVADNGASSDAAVADSGASSDAAVADNGAASDAATADNGAASDAATADNGASTDAAVADSGASSDAATADNGASTDAATADNGASSDAAVADSGASSDAAVADNGASTDAMAADSGASTDAAVADSGASSDAMAADDGASVDGEAADNGEAAPTEAAPAATIMTAALLEKQLHEVSTNLDTLKEDTFATKSRLLLLREEVLQRAVSGARIQLRYEDDMGGQYDLTQVYYAIDRETVFSGTGEGLKKLDGELIYDRMLAPGAHQLTVVYVYKGRPWGVFRYMTDYTFRVESGYDFVVDEGKSAELIVVATEQGNAFTAYEERPNIKFKYQQYDLVAGSKENQ